MNHVFLLVYILLLLGIAILFLIRKIRSLMSSTIPIGEYVFDENIDFESYEALRNKLKLKPVDAFLWVSTHEQKLREELVARDKISLLDFIVQQGNMSAEDVLISAVAASKTKVIQKFIHRASRELVERLIRTTASTIGGDALQIRVLLEEKLKTALPDVPGLSGQLETNNGTNFTNPGSQEPGQQR